MASIPEHSKTRTQIIEATPHPGGHTREPRLVLLYPVLGRFDFDWSSATSITVGRGSELRCDWQGSQVRIQVPDEFVSKSHVEIRRDGGQWSIRDLSSNGTWLNKERLEREQPTWIDDGELVRVGSHLFWFGARVDWHETPASFGFYSMVELRAGSTSTDAACVEFVEQCRSLPARLSIFLAGETGSGKSFLARALHELRAANRPFVSVNCANVTENLFEATMFGARKGAYTDARADMVGLVEQAHGGTLFLDEISEIPNSMQAKLLTFLDTGEYRPLGEKQLKRSECFLISASNKPIDGQVAAGLFREDLFFRLSALQFSIPPLRQRKADIAYCVRQGLQKPETLTVDILYRWLLYDWPGNLRELSQCLAKLEHLGKDPLLQFDVMPTSGSAGTVSARGIGPSRYASMTRAELAVEFLKVHLEFGKLAEAFQISESELTSLLDQHQLTKTDLLANNFRKSELRFEVLKVAGSKRAVAQLFDLKDVYAWYK